MPNTQKELVFLVNRAKNHYAIVAATLMKVVFTNVKQLETFLRLKQI